MENTLKRELSRDLQTAATDVQLAHFTVLFQRVAPVYAERWITLLRGKPVKWRKIQPWRVWPCDVYESHPPRVEWTAMVNQAITLAQARKVRDAHVLACGHGGESIETLALSQLQERLCSRERGSEGTLLEGFVSLSPGRLALATNHEGGCWLMDYTAPQVPKQRS